MDRGECIRMQIHGNPSRYFEIFFSRLHCNAGFMSSVVDFKSTGYEPIRVIGHGRFGSVFLVRDSKKLECMFVCKVVFLDSLGDADRRLAEQEVSLLRTLDHRNIVKFHDCLRMAGGGSLGLLMEHCDGGDLRHAIKEQSKLGSFFPESQVMTWFGQILDGMRYIHACRIIHRDLKTSNIFLQGPPPYRCLIGDFGISRVLEETLSAAHTVIGTPYYLSPEVCKRDPYTYKSDMWSLGACLYELTMLRMAFKASNLLSLVTRIINEPFDPMDDAAGFSPDLCGLIERLLKKRPEERPSATQLVRETFVKKFLDDKDETDPKIFHPVELKRRPTLRGRPVSRRFTLSLPEEAAVVDSDDNAGFETVIEPEVESERPVSRQLLPVKPKPDLPPVTTPSPPPHRF